MILILISALNTLLSQTTQPGIENVQFYFDESIQAIIVTYDLVSYSDLESYEIELSFIDGSNITIYPKTVAGDLGKEISGGVGKQIVWEIYNDIDGLAETAQPQLNIIAINDVPVDPSIAIIMDQINTSIAQKYHFRIERDGLMILGVGAGVSSIVFKLKADDYIGQQNLAPNYDEYEILGKKADTYYTLSYVSGGIAVVSIGLAAYQYIRGDKTKNQKNSLSIVPSFNKGAILAWTREF
ncbi:MAG: hypothetical protein KAR19_16260 [Bacteroidales bacterium]|nr:hypothetical protein [Bacteroidales bacterium]